MARRRSKSSQYQAGRAIRCLQFDTLEDRRLLAGLSVFVFEDGDANRSWSDNERGLADRIVFLDTNSNGLLDRSEPWSQTDEFGQAEFENLSAGQYLPTLLGGSGSFAQTTPVTTEREGTWLSDSGAYKVVAWQDEHRVWLTDDQSLSLFDLTQRDVVKRVSFPGKPVSASIDTTRGVGLVIVQLNSEVHQLVGVDLVRGHILELDNSIGNWKSVARTSSNFVAVDSNATGSRLVSVSISQNVIVPYVGSIFGSHIELLGSSASSRLGVVETKGPETTLRLFDVSQGGLQSVGQRSFSEPFQRWVIDDSGRYVAGQRNSGTLIMDAAHQLNDLAILSKSDGPLAFDSARGLLLAGSTQSGEVVAWNLSNWTVAYAVTPHPSQTGGSNRSNWIDATLAASPLGSSMILANAAGLYRHGTAIARPASIELKSNQERRTVSFGQRKVRDNDAPTWLAVPSLLVGTEDASLNIGSEQLRRLSQDANGDLLSYWIVEPPRFGNLNWSQSSGGIYTPAHNYEGRDSLVVKAFDGVNWSRPYRLGIDVTPVPDLPTGIDFVSNSVAENVGPGEALGHVTVLDPDRDASYRVTVGDSRFLVVDGVLKLAEGVSLDFESESTVTFEIVASDRNHPQERTSRTITLEIQDANDPPSILEPEWMNTFENESASEVGRLSYIDQDGDQVTWSVSDERFEVVDGLLRLKPGIALDYESETEVDLTLTATDELGSSTIHSTSFHILNQPDVIPQITRQGGLAPNRVVGAELGNLNVQLDGQHDGFSFQVSDERFEVLNGALRLRSGFYLDKATDGSEVDIELTVTSTTTGETFSEQLTIEVDTETSPWQNTQNPMDVNGDGVVTPLDAIIIINLINRDGMGDLPASGSGEGEGILGQVDVNGDGQVTPLDVLIIINYLNNPTGNPPAGASSGDSSDGEQDDASVDEDCNVHSQPPPDDDLDETIDETCRVRRPRRT